MDGRRARQLGIAVALGLGALLWSWDPAGQAPRPVLAPDKTPQSAASAGAPAPARPARRKQTAGVKAPPLAASDCAPRAELDCYDGDVYWFDGCGEPSERAQSCAQRGCEDARCRPDPKVDDCGRTSAYGQCHGTLAEACIAGQLVRVDCASQRQRCVMTSEGAACLPLDAKNGCRGDEPPRCEGDRLKLCVDGVYRTLDCAARRAHCSDQGLVAQCEANAALALPPGLPARELCDNKDNDADGEVDEGDACTGVPLVAFIAEGADSDELQLRMQQDLEVLNRVLAPIKFRWARTRPAPASYLRFDPKNMQQAASLLGQSESSFLAGRQAGAADEEARGLDFYIAVLYVDELQVQPPKSGMSTLPNARCGGVRISDAPSPVSGLIVLTPARQPETLAHEMGHYLGLCHTHEQIARFALYSDALAECERTGDSICDTPNDPGPPSCFQTEPCVLMCRDASRPDAFNVMSYYLGCRRALSPEQHAEVASNLQLRRGWFRCQDPRGCPCDPARKTACPEQMSCRPGSPDETTWYCGLDGAHLPGTPCEDSTQCSDRAFCAGSGQDSARCIRPCDGEDCSCAEVGLSVRVCREDLGV